MCGIIEQTLPKLGQAQADVQRNGVDHAQKGPRRSTLQDLLLISLIALALLVAVSTLDVFVIEIHSGILVDHWWGHIVRTAAVLGIASLSAFSLLRWRELKGEIAARDRAEQTSRESAAINRALLDAVPDVMIRVDAEGTILDFRPTKWTDTPATPAEVIGRSVFDVIPKGGADLAMRNVRQALRTGEPQLYEYQIPIGGEQHHRESRVAVAGEGEVLLIVRDITERKRAEEALRESEEKYRTLFQLASDAILTVTPEGAILDANVAAAELLGYTKEEIIGLTGREHIIAPEVFEETDRAWGEQLGRQGHFLTETVWLRKDGSRVPVAVSGKPIEVMGELQFQLIARDLTERKRMEEEIQKARERLEGKVERQMLRRNPYRLTFRELTVLHHVADGLADKEIAVELGISPLTVHKHVANILAKMDASSRTEAGVRAQREGLLD